MNTRILGRNPVALFVVPALAGLLALVLPAKAGTTNTRRRCLFGLLVMAVTGNLAAQDTVTLATGTGGQSKITGRILDYTGRELRLERASGRQESYPAEQVLKVETSYGREHTEADSLLANGQFAQALALYGQARELGQPMQILEGVGKPFEPAFWA